MLKQQRDGALLTLTLARPERGNALAPDLVEALLDAVQAAEADPQLQTLQLQGEGRHFCTGLDLGDLETSSDADWLWRLVRIETLLDRLWRSPLATVVQAQGRAWGAGADLFAACEQRQAAPGTTFRFPGVQFGIVLGTRRLAARIGTDAARRLLIGGGELDAAGALAAGLVTSVGTEAVPAGTRLDRATAAALRAASRGDAPGAADTDLAHLVRSAAQPGLRARIQAYRQRLLAARA